MRITVSVLIIVLSMIGLVTCGDKYNLTEEQYDKMWARTGGRR